MEIEMGRNLLTHCAHTEPWDSMTFAFGSLVDDAKRNCMRMYEDAHHNKRGSGFLLQVVGHSTIDIMAS